MGLVMYDAIDVSQFTGLTMDAAAGYVDGSWPTFATLGRHVPPGTKLVSVSVFGNPADCIDVEKGDVNNNQGATWARRRIDEGHWKPIVYTSASNATAMFNALRAVGVQRNQIRFWSAHYTTRHICSPSVCGYPQADGTQWTAQAHGRNLDQSELENSFFQQAPQPSPPNMRLKEPTMQITFGPDQKAGIPIPGGVSHFRLACSQGAKIAIQWPGTTVATRTVELSSSRRHDEALPSDQQGQVILFADEALGPVYLAWI